MAFQRKKVAAALAYAVSVGTTATLLTAVPVYAQDMRVNVTGSNIKRVDNETASPIQVITREDIERTGASSVNELLQFIPSAGFGLDDRFTNGFAPGAGGLNIRNLGFNSTLILLNGKRMPTYPFAQQVGSSQGFQDLNSIPIGSVDRIEILKDGASAIYGADAVAGVVNVILRNNYVGAEAGASYGIAQEGDGDAWTVNGIFGMGDLAKDRYNVMLSGYYFKRKEIFARDRDFASNEDLRGRGGADRRSAYGFPSSYINNDTGEVAFGPTCDPAQVRTYCRYNRAAFGSLLPESERMNVSLKGSFMVTKEIELFADLMYSENKSYATGFPAPSTDDPLIGSDQLPIGHPNNPFPGSTATVLHRYQGVGTRDDDTTSKLSRGVFGAKGTIKSWDWEAYASLNEIDVENRQLNQVLAVDALRTINDGSYNFDQPFANPALNDSLRYNGYHTGNSKMWDYGAKASGEVWSLPAGPVLAAIGAQYIKQEAEDIPDPQIAAGNALGISASAAYGDQKVTAVYGEIIVPIVKGVEVTGALRYDSYSGTGDFSNTSPKIGVRWQPTKSLLLRATYSEAFRAPSIFETSPATQTSFTFGIKDPVKCVNGDEPDCLIDVKRFQRGNPDLKPEKSDVWNLGVVFEPTNNSSISADFYQIEREDEIGSFADQLLVDLFPNDPNIVVRDPVTGSIQSINQVPVQLNKTKMSGLDIEGRVRIPMEQRGRLELRGNLSYIHEYEFTTLGDDATQTTSSLNGTFSYPRVRGGWDIIWSYGAHETTLNGYYIHSYDQLSSSPSPTKVGAVGIWNLLWKWNVSKNFTVNAAVLNLFDTDPPFADTTAGSNAGYDFSIHDPRGQFFQIGVNYRFK